MIAAKDPQEFIPSGRQQLLNHPGPYELYDDEQEGLSAEILRNEFEKVSITDNKHKEWWIIRKSPQQHEESKTYQEKDDNKSCFDGDYTNCNSLSENSWTWKNVDSPKINKRLSDIQGSKKRNSNDAEPTNNESFRVHKTNLNSNLKCQNLGVMEEELYVKDNVVIWSKGITSTGNCTQFDSSRVTICSYTSQYLIKHAKWCTFYCELPSFNNANQNFHAKVDEPQGTPMPSICIVDNHNFKVFSVDSEDFVTTLPFPVGGVWNTKFGIILERDKNLGKKYNEDGGPTVFSMVHPLDEVSPVAIVQGSVRLIEDYSISIVYTSEKPSICMMYDSHTSQHSVYAIRKVKNDEWFEMSTKLRSEPPSLHNLSSRLKNRLSMWETRSETPSPLVSRPTSVSNVHTHSQGQSKSHSPMAAISRCQSPTVSPLVGSNPWLPKLSRLHNSLRVANTNTTLAMTSSQVEVPEDYHYVNPLLCFEHIWTDSFTTQDNTGPASKVFLIDDLVGRSYLCYLIPSRLQLSMVCVEMSSNNNLTFGLLTSISAKDAVPIPHLHMLAILEHTGSIVLYSGLTAVGKLHIGGVLAQHILSPCMIRSFSQFNSPFQRRSTLLPQYSTPISGPNFDEHFLSPVLPTGCNIQTSLPIILDPYKTKGGEMGRTQLNGLRDAIADRITLQYSDGTYYRITLPPIATSALIENCLNALRQVLSRDSTMTLLTRWYAVRNAPGPVNLNIEQEWDMFTALTYELLGYDTEQSSEMPCDSPMTPLYVAKRQRQTTLGSNSDWNYLVDSKLNKTNYKTTSTLLNLQVPVKTVSSTKNVEIKINTNSVLFSNIRIIHYTLHLLYEDFKLNLIRTGELPLLAQFLSKLSSDLTLKNYVMYYWKDFPDHCPKYSSESSVIGVSSLKNVVTWSCIQKEPENVIEYVYLLLKNGDILPYPYIPNVNERSKAVVQLCGVYIKGSRNTGTEISIDNFVNNVVLARTFSTPKTKQIDPSENISEKIALLMTEMGITVRDLDSFPIAINLLLYGALWKCREKPPVDWCPEAYNLLQRPDLAAQAELVKKNKLQESAKKQLLVPNSISLPEILPAMKQVEDMDQEDGMEDIDSALLKMRFPEDHRVTEARRLLQSSKPVTIALVQRPDVADHDFIEEQEKHLYAICARTMALPVGRGMFTLRTATPVVTEPLPLPKLYLSGKAPPRGITVELGHIDYPQNMQHWPLFHNGVANGLRISPDAHNIDSTWIIFNKPKNTAETNYEHAGFLMALGLNGHLTNLTILNTYNYLSKSNEMTSIGILLGLSSAMRGTANTVITKVLSLHLEALLPPTSMELDVSQNLQVAALLGVGLVYQGTAHRHITEVLLWEIGRPPGPEMENSTDRESYSLAAGLALGLVTLQQGGRPSGLSDLNVPDTLHYYMVGGNKRVLEGSQRDKYRVPSFQIREGSNVNLDVTAPGATLALGLMYLKSGNKTLAEWMSPPTTQYLLDFVRPDFLMLRILSRSLIMWDEICPDRSWIENQVPESIRPFCMVKPTTSSSDIDYEAMNQAYCNIIAGACFAIGLKYAGSANNEAFSALLHFCHMFISLTSKSIAELAGKPTIETCLNVLLLSASMVMAGTGNLQILRIVRHLRRRVGLASSAVVTYGSHLAIHMALGLLFLGGGRYTLSNSPSSVAALICAFYPKFPTHSADNRYHLQAFRHLYVLAVEPRLIIPKDVNTGRICYASLKVVYLDGSYLFLKGPCLIPDLNLLAKVSIEDERYWCVEFDRGRNWDQLQKLLASSGLIEVKQRAGCLSYMEDNFGYRTELARTLTHSKTIPWNPLPSAITSFSSNAVVRHFSDNFLNPNCNTSKDECEFVKMLTRATYECVIKDKETILSNVIALIKIIQDSKGSPSTLQIWQFKLVCAQVLENSLSTHLISSEVMLSLKQKLIDIVNKWEPSIQNYLRDYIVGKDLRNMDCEKKFVSYVTLYDIPFNICGTLHNEDLNSLEIINCFSGQSNSSETIMKLLNILGLQL